MFVLPEEFSLEFLSHSLRQQVLTAEKTCTSLIEMREMCPYFATSPE
jgi:hypothetical protein